MKEVVVGKIGDQKFPISAAGVSRRHAKVTTDGVQWFVEDLNSTNGTFVRDGNGEFHRVSRMAITEDTVIRLGDGSANGYSFMAHHVIEEDPDNYSYEFYRLQQWAGDFRRERERCQRAGRMRGLVQIGISLVVILISFLPSLEQHVQMMVLRIGMLIPPLYTFLVTGRNKMQAIYERQQRILVCPRCGRPLSEYEIGKQFCMACKAHS